MRSLWGSSVQSVSVRFLDCIRIDVRTQTLSSSFTEWEKEVVFVLRHDNYKWVPEEVPGVCRFPRTTPFPYFLYSPDVDGSLPRLSDSRSHFPSECRERQEG